MRTPAHIDHYHRTCHMRAQGLVGDWPPLGWPARTNDVSSRPRVCGFTSRAPLAICEAIWELAEGVGVGRGRYAVRARPVRKGRGYAGPPSLRAVSRLPLEGEQLEMRIRGAHSRGAFEGCWTWRRCARAKAALA